ncbi:hypothetical protein [Streptomyces sp. PanSC9]|uniref:hypothetical protein n=1 Tax=Streptomyces sp. PanSC9 TaxID=1520461 RepID=UPI00161F5AFC|nr:hypothetical protein [Streptomyces sp. PanSC9]
MNLAKKILADHASSGAIPRAQADWVEAGLPATGAITVEQLEQARAKVQGA